MKDAGQDPDVIFLSYDEPNAEENFRRLQSLAPRAKRVHGVKGIFNAYLAAARMSSTLYFYVVEADSWVVDGFKFGMPRTKVVSDVYHWKALNAVNGLDWYNGSLKLLKRSTVLMMDREDENAVDFFITMKGKIALVQNVATENRFNSSPFAAWRAGFRECAKITSGIIEAVEAPEILKVWQTVGADKPHGQWCMLGARQGAAFGKTHKKSDEIAKINDIAWLKARFEVAKAKALLSVNSK